MDHDDQDKVLVDNPKFLEHGLMKLHHVSELMKLADEKPIYVVDELCQEGSISILAARPKVGKSTLALDMTYCVATGTEFLGKFATKKSPVFYLALEERPQNFSQNMRLRGVDGTEGIYVQFDKIGGEALKSLENLCRMHPPGLVIIDHLTLFCPISDITNYSEVTGKLAPIRNLARETKAHIMLLHHMNKGAAGQLGVLGSTAIAGAVDTIMVIEEKNNKRVLSTTQRYGSDIKDAALFLDDDTRCLHIEGDGVSDKTYSTEQNIAQSILDRLEGVNLSREDLLASIKGKSQTKIQVLKHLVESGQIMREGAGTKTAPYVFSLPQGQESDDVGIELEVTNGL